MHLFDLEDFNWLVKIKLNEMKMQCYCPFMTLSTVAVIVFIIIFVFENIYNGFSWFLINFNFVFFLIIISKLTVSMGKILTGYVLCYIVVYKSAQTTAALSARQYQYYLLFIISTDFFLSVFFFLLGLRERPTDLPDLYSFIFR